jgi:hypothetical protein
MAVISNTGSKTTLAPSGSINCWEFLEWLRKYWRRKQDPAPWRQLVKVSLCESIVLSYERVERRLTALAIWALDEGKHRAVVLF